MGVRCPAFGGALVVLSHRLPFVLLPRDAVGSANELAVAVEVGGDHVAALPLCFAHMG